MQAIDELKKSLNSVHRFSDEQVDAFIAKLKYKKLSKKDFLLKPTQKCNFMAFIQKGSLRFYALNESDEHTLHYFTENVWVADYESFVSQQPKGRENWMAIGSLLMIPGLAPLAYKYLTKQL